MQNLAETGYLVLFGVAIFLIGTWMIGRWKTPKLRSRIAQNVANRFEATTSKVSVRLLGNTGAKFSYHQKSNSPLPKLESTILLLDRSNIFHFAYCKIRGRTDQLQIRANLGRPALFNLELATQREKKNLEELLKPKIEGASELLIDDLSDQFYVVVSDLEAGERLFEKQEFYADFKAIAPFLTRLSISRKEPHVFASVVLVPEAMEPFEKFILSLAKSVKRRKKSQ
ncbi:MAG: hypothetical protein ACFFAD_11410 [Candidatus Hermodarchaeota archaeon]